MRLWQSVVGVVATLASLVPATIPSDRRDKPQRMWDPGKGSLLGRAVAAFGFENVTVSNQTAQLGSTAFLHCRVRNLAHQHVSWLRRRDYHLLSSGLQTYSRDERFGVVRPEDGDDWILQIKFVQKRDEGVYECQSLEPPQFILWYHNNQMVNYDQTRGGTTVTMDHHDPTTSRLTITSAAPSDSGNYSCSAANTVPAFINVFVSQGDKTAAIQRLGSGSWGLLEMGGFSLPLLLVCAQVVVCVAGLAVCAAT